MRIEEITDPGKLTSYSTAWESLLTRSPSADLFQTYEWIMTWLEAFWGSKPLRFLLAWQDGAPMALAPLLQDHLGELACSPGFVLPVNQHARRSNIICTDQPSESIGAILQHLNQRIAVRLILQQLDQHSATVQPLLDAAHAYDLTTMMRTEAVSPMVNIDGSWSSYLNSRSTHLRSELRRKRRRLQKAGRLEFETRTDARQTAMQAVLCTEHNSWKEAAGSSITSVPATRYFYDALARRVAKRDWLRIHLLFLGGVPIAYIYGVVYRRVYYALKTSYDAAFAEYSPGTVLFEYALRDAFDEQYEAFEFLGYQSRWKNEMANDVRTHVNLCVFSHGLIRCEWCRLYQQRLKPFAKEHLPFASAVKHKLHELRSPESSLGGDRRQLSRSSNSMN